MTARCDVATKSADSVNAKSDLSEEEIEAKAKVGTDCRAPSLNDRNFSERAFTVGIGVPVGTGNFEFGVGLQMGTGNWGRYSLLQIVVLLLSKAVKVFTEELVPANPDILEDTWKTDEGPQKKRQLLLREDLSHWQNVVTTDLLRLIKKKKTC
ncbi:hypothetical protein Bca52824_046714 [Brassica carinata]|uniref:Uncharacterized protein n=1 Tax=Brassica carinata TaxID=52824 RepID=A0A8X7RHQ8_BRACI|nr:hypothetical protein Bca52824_046714 [Brassica carinata]